MLSIEDIVNIDILIGSAATVSSVFDVGLILGSSETIPEATRVSEYASLSAMTAGGFATTSPEYLAASKYFGVNPAPEKVLVARIRDGETPLAALRAVVEINPNFDGIFLCEATTAHLREVAEGLNTMDKYHLYYNVAGTVAAATAADGAFSVMKGLNSRRTFGLYSTEEYAAAGAMGEMAGLIHKNPDIAIQACYANIASLQPVPLTSAEVDSIKALNGNVYIARRNRGMLEQGATGEGMRIDDSLYLDIIRSEIQDALFEQITASGRRLPQQDSTTALLISSAVAVLERYAAIGIIAPGAWTGSDAGNVQTGDILENGYFVYADSYNAQSQTDRLAHKAMPISIGMILGGSVESVSINLYAQL